MEEIVGGPLVEGERQAKQETGENNKTPEEPAKLPAKEEPKPLEPEVETANIAAQPEEPASSRTAAIDLGAVLGDEVKADLGDLPVVSNTEIEAGLPDVSNLLAKLEPTVYQSTDDDNNTSVNPGGIPTAQRCQEKVRSKLIVQTSIAHSTDFVICQM